ncbi:hypothetical protein ACQPZX_24490 [Actinoplanes sp. CA-142083]|uniref:hypothetical protein n=1 Tax=Actinoplanes sp. CA-142083 TaxID=3239903 RepID=UPI003D947D6A
MAKATHKAVAYQPVTDPQYAQLAATEFAVVSTDRHAEVLFGPCPRCRGVFRDFLPATLVKGTRAIGNPFRRTAQPTDDLVPMTCLCELTHANRPEGERGCGAYWKLLLTEGP